MRTSHRRTVLAGTTLCVDAAERRSESRGRVLLSLQTRGFLFCARSAAPRIRSVRRSHHCFFSSLRPHAAHLRGLSEFKLAVLAAVESSVPREAGLVREGLRYHAGAHTERQPAACDDAGAAFLPLQLLVEWEPVLERMNTATIIPDVICSLHSHHSCQL